MARVRMFSVTPAKVGAPYRIASDSVRVFSSSAYHPRVRGSSVSGMGTKEGMLARVRRGASREMTRDVLVFQFQQRAERSEGMMENWRMAAMPVVFQETRLVFGARVFAHEERIDMIDVKM